MHQRSKSQTCKITVLGILVKNSSTMNNNRYSIWESIMTIKGGHQNYFNKSLKLTQWTSNLFYVDIQKDLNLYFSLCRHNDNIDFAEGSINAQILNSKYLFDCQIRDKIQDRECIQVRLEVAIDQERLGFGNHNLEQSLQSEDTKPRLDPSSIHDYSGKKTRQRHHSLMVHSSPQTNKITSKNRILSSANIRISNIMLIKESNVHISELRFYDKTRNELIGQISIEQGAIQDLTSQKLIVPKSYQQIIIQAKNIYGIVGIGRCNFDIIGIDQDSKIGQVFLLDRDENSKGKILFEYGNKKQVQQKKQQKQSIVQELSQKQRKQNPSASKNSLILSKLYNNNIMPSKLTNNFSRGPRIVRQTVNQKILPTPNNELMRLRSQTVHKKDLSIGHSFDYQSEVALKNQRWFNNDSPNKNNYKELFPDKDQYMTPAQVDNLKNIKRNLQKNDDRQEYQRYLHKSEQKRYKTLDPQERPSYVLPNSTHLIRLSSVMVQFYSEYLQRHGISIQKDRTCGKFLNIHSTISRIHRTDVLFTSPNLYWVINNCQININENNRLNIQLCQNWQKSCIGEISINFQELKANLQRQNFYRGHLVSHQQKIAQVIVYADIFNLRSKLRKMKSNQMKQSSIRLQKVNERLKLGLSPPRRQFNTQQDEQRRIKKFEELHQIKQYPIKRKKKLIKVMRPL